MAAGVLGHPQGSDDIVQQAFAIGVEKDLRFDSEGQLVSWLSGVVRKCALNQRRKVFRRKTQPTDPAVLSHVESDKELQRDHQQAMKLAETQAVFDDDVLFALKQLSEDARVCLLLRTVEQLSYKEISELMSIPEGTALSLVHRSRKKLRELLSTHEFSPGNSGGGDNE